jgi:guanylate kinase
MGPEMRMRRIDVPPLPNDLCGGQEWASRTSGGFLAAPDHVGWRRPMTSEVLRVNRSEAGVLFIVASPSGGGKTTLVREVMGKLSERGHATHFSVSHTTRPRRPAETDGVDYHFVDQDSFEAMVDRREFLEWASYNDHLYGTSRSEVEPRLAEGIDVFLDIEVQGATQVKTLIPEVVKVFVYPPSYEVLKERLLKRRQDSEDAIRRRLEWAMREFSAAGEFDYAIINDRLEEAVEALLGICTAEHQRPKHMKPRLDAIREAYQIALKKDFA